jgi:demethoxyubiquinone hydroxylase (CLK1/Coq7/Cat5 family)
VPFCFGVGLGYLLGARGSRRMGWYGAMGVVNDTTTEFSIDEHYQGYMEKLGK